VVPHQRAKDFEGLGALNTRFSLSTIIAAAFATFTPKLTSKTARNKPETALQPVAVAEE